MNMLRDMITGNNQELVRAKLTDIDETINDTAVDVFVYDTSKDSDGGAWRHRTQHTSWYAEASSASRDPNTRSTRAEFPAVAVIVAEADKVTIYDGDDPSLPMWMVFNAGGGYPSTYALGETAWGGPNAVLMLNGTLCTPRGLGGLPYISFIDDACYRISTDGFHSLAGGVAVRNSGMTDTISNSSKTIVNGTVNDVAMTVLPDAPTDPATGIAVPTIAVATDGGVSVIKDDGTVVDITHTVQTKVGNVVFREADGALGYSIGATIYNNGRIHYDHDLPMADVAKGAYFSGANSDEYYTAWDGDTSVSGRILPQTVGISDFNSLADGSVAGPGGINRVDPDPTTPANGMVAYTTSSYTTGWMPGSIKMAALADTTAETLAGSELVPNGDFPAGLSDGDVGYDNGDGTVDGWTAANNAVLSIDTNRLKVANNVTNYGTAYHDLSLVSGKRYVVSFDLDLGTSYRCRIAVGTAVSNENILSGINITANGSYAYTFTAAATNVLVFVNNDTADASYILLDNVSVRLADPDRSVNGNGLAVHGSITKAAVATGADVVAYSNFSSSNYLEQPYNPDLDFGTGDFSVMFWFKGTDYYGMFVTTDVTGQVKGFYCAVTGLTDESNYEFMIGNGTEYTTYSSSISTNIDADVWTHVAFVVEDGDVKIYENGSLFYGPTATTRSVAGGGPLTIGYRPWDNAQNYSGSLALLRISGTAPTADQIKKIYEDEKVLFQEGAKATLTGNSDAVTALAHDPDTDLLHVGTSGGRSVFQGLRRVEEHTGTNSQSLAAISAVDGLVVEGK